MPFFSAGILLALFGTLGIGLGDFFAGLSARKIDEKKTLLLIYVSQSLSAFLYWLVFKHTVSLHFESIVIILIAGVFQAIGLLLFYKAMTIEKISLISPIFATYSALAILFGVFVLKDHLSLLKVSAILIIFIGTLLASSNFSFKNISFSKGVGVSLFGTIFFAVAFLLMIIIFKFNEYYFANFLYSFSSLLTAVVINRKILPKIIKVKYKALPAVTGLVYATSNIVWALSLVRLPSSVFGAIAATFPAVTSLAGFLLLKERLARVQVIGVITILIGLVFLGL